MRARVLACGLVSQLIYSCFASEALVVPIEQERAARVRCRTLQELERRARRQELARRADEAEASGRN